MKISKTITFLLCFCGIFVLYNLAVRQNVLATVCPYPNEYTFRICAVKPDGTPLTGFTPGHLLVKYMDKTSNLCRRTTGKNDDLRYLEIGKKEVISGSSVVIQNSSAPNCAEFINYDNLSDAQKDSLYYNTSWAYTGFNYPQGMVNLHRNSCSGSCGPTVSAGFLNAEDNLYFGILSNSSEFKCGANPTIGSVANPGVDLCLPDQNLPMYNGGGPGGCSLNCRGGRDATSWCTTNGYTQWGLCMKMTVDDCTQYRLDIKCVSTVIASPTPTSTPLPTVTPTTVASPTPSLPPWFITRGGDTFVKSGITFGSLFMQNTLQRTTINNTNLTALGFSANETPYFATFNFLQQTGIFPALCPRCSGKGAVVKNYFKNTYDDANDTAAGGWYTAIFNKLNDAGFIDQTFTQATIPASFAAINDAVPTSMGSPLVDTNNDGFNVVNITNVTTFIDIGRNHVCDKKIIFMVNGNLQIGPNLLNSANNKGCIFISSGTIIIGNGLQRTASVTPNISYDEIDAFLIGNAFQDSNDTATYTDGLLIKGSVVAGTVAFNRDVRKLTLFSPAELIIYDDRFISLFGSILDQPLDFSIEEKQFVNTLINP